MKNKSINVNDKICENSSPIKEQIMQKRDVIVNLDLCTRILKKEDKGRCICHAYFDKDDKDDKISIFNENEIITGIQITQNKDNQIRFEELISSLRLLGYPITGSLISIYCSNIEDYIYLGADPLDANLILDKSEFINLNIIKLRITAFVEEKLLNKQSAFSQIFSDNDSNTTANPLQKSSLNKDSKSNAIKRTKERKIGYIIEKVNTWRKYYNGYYDDKGNFTKFSLDEAAKKIDISKKSLDDYLLQLRLGRKYGFDFNMYKNNRVGILRAFVKENRKKIPDEK